MKTVITDLDGTLLNDGQLSLHTIRVLKDFQKNNRLILATGRNLKHIEQIYKQLDMDKYHTGGLILVNGMEYLDFSDKETIIIDSLSLKETKFIINVCHLLMFRVTVVNDEMRIKLDSLYDRIINELRFIIKHKPRIKYEKKEVIENVQKLEISGTIFVNFFYYLLKKVLYKYEIVKVNKWWIEIYPKGINKANMVKHIIRKYNIDNNDLYIFGDGENDIEMLKLTSHSYSPIDAMDIVKQYSNNICLSCKDDGVVKIIKNIMEEL